MTNVLEVRKLRKIYPAFSLSDVSFGVPHGYITGFVGPNGAGKTTTIKLMLSLIAPDGGEVTLFGQPGGVLQNAQIGAVMDTPPYVSEWRVRDVERALAPFYAGWDHALFTDYIRRFGLGAKQRVKELSRGMKVKLQIAAALSHGARLLLLDEPTSGLDPVARDELCDILREFVCGEDKSVFFSTHITSDLEKTADYIVFILNGGIAFAGTKDSLMGGYARVAGGRGELSPEQKRLVIGCREHAAGFEGMVRADDLPLLPAGILAEPPSLDEIIIFMNRGANIHE